MLLGVGIPYTYLLLKQQQTMPSMPSIEVGAIIKVKSQKCHFFSALLTVLCERTVPFAKCYFCFFVIFFPVYQLVYSRMISIMYGTISLSLVTTIVVLVFVTKFASAKFHGFILYGLYASFLASAIFTEIKNLS